MSKKKEVEFSNPYIVRIQNLTDEKLYGVKAFDFEHEKQSKISYSTGNGNESYKELLREINNLGTIQKLGRLRYHSSCDYGKFQERQMNCVVRVTNKYSSGLFTSIPKSLGVDVYQHQSNIIIVSDIDADFFRRTNFVFEYLMPETRIDLHIYPIVNN